MDDITEQQASALPAVSASSARELPSRKEFLRLLDLEIADARSAGEAGGWTGWAVAGALATVVALLASTWEAEKVNVETAGAIFIITLLVYSVMRDLRRLGAQSWPRSHEARFLVQRHLIDRRGAQAVLTAVSLLAILVVWYLGDRGADRPFRVAAYLYYALYPVAGLIFVGSSLLNLPLIPSKEGLSGARKAFFTLMDWIWRGLALVAVFGFLRKLAFVPSGQSLVDTRVGVLAAVTLFLLVELVDRRARRASLVVDLTNTRRDLVLGYCDLPTAVRRFEDETLGILAGRILDEDITAASAEFDQAEALLKSVELAHARVTVEIDALAATEAESPAELVQIKVCSDCMGQAVSETRKAGPAFKSHMRRADRHVRRTQLRAAFGSKSDPRAALPIEEALRSLVERGIRLVHSMNDHLQRLADHGAKLDVLEKRTKALTDATKQRVRNPAA